MTDLPKGFYQGPDGQQRFWDGEHWHESPSPSEASGTQKNRVQWSAKRKAIAVVIGAALLAVAGITGVNFVQQQAAATAAAEEIAAIQRAETEAAAAEAAEEQERAEAAAAAESAAEEAELEQRRQNRREAVSEIEDDIQAMAAGHLTDGIITGEIISTSCTTTGGIALDDIDIRSMLFECFVATEDNGDGMFGGYYYHARANWDTGSWTYGLGGE